jgi:hypothetical protein
MWVMEMILFQRLRVIPNTMRLDVLESLSPFLFMYMKNVQIGGRTCHVR